MKAFVIILTFILCACNDNYNSDLAKVNPKDTIAAKPWIDSVDIGNITFGRFCRECSGECTQLFRLSGGHVTSIWTGDKNSKIEGLDSVSFTEDKDITTIERLKLVGSLIRNLPKVMRESQPAKYTFGCPDCASGCGIYIEYWYEYKYGFDEDISGINGVKRFIVDSQSSNNAPKEVVDYAKFVSGIIDSLQN